VVDVRDDGDVAHVVASRRAGDDGLDLGLHPVALADHMVGRHDDGAQTSATNGSATSR
jgi:hypothetical protein